MSADTFCNLCNAGNATPLGRLGHREHFKCRACGSLFSRSAQPPQVTAAEKAAPRRFTGEPPTGFGDLTT